MWRREGEGKKKRNKCWSVPPLMTNMQTHTRTHTQSAAPKTATFPASFPRGGPEGKGIFSGRGRRLADGVERTGPAIPPSPGACCRPGCLCLRAGAFVSLSITAWITSPTPPPRVPLRCCTECLEEDGCEFLNESRDRPSRLWRVDLVPGAALSFVTHSLCSFRRGPRFDTHL